MGPKSFITCFICSKEFGSKSIEFHESKCLERWRVSNKGKSSDIPVRPVCKNNQTIICTNCHSKVPEVKRSEHSLSCLENQLKSNNNMTGVVKPEFSPKKGKENLNNANQEPVTKIKTKNVCKSIEKDCEEVKIEEDVSSTSKRSVRPQTKILRRPTPNLKHPVIQIDSDDSSGDSSCSEKGKENPKRLKTGNESSDSTHKPKNFIIYNKNNVEKNTKNASKERTLAASIPNPCNSCNRSLAPERLHSHAKKDARGLMYRKTPNLEGSVTETLEIPQPSDSRKTSHTLQKSPSFDVKMASPQKKVPQPLQKSPSFDVKMLSPLKKVNQPLRKSPTSETKTPVKLKAVEASTKSLSLDVKTTDFQEKGTVASENSLTSSDIKVSPKDKTPPIKVESVTAQDNSQVPSTYIKMSSPRKKVTNKSSSRNKKLNTEIKTPQPSNKESSFEDCLQRESLEVPCEVKTPVLDTSEELVDLEKVCYICHNEFKASALLLHESKCLEEWKRTNNALTPNLRKLPPRRPEDELDMSPDENDPAWHAVQSQLVPCPVCGRTFFPERMPVHRRVCKGKPSPKPLKRASSLREHSAKSTNGDDSKPAALYVPCEVCGRNYGSWVITMHEQQCLRKWTRENGKMGPEEQSEDIKTINGEDVASLVELGDNAWESHLQQLVPCPLCTRTFFPDRLEIHQRSCKGPPNNPKRPGSNRGGPT